MKAKSEPEDKSNRGMEVAWIGVIIMWIGSRMSSEYWLAIALLGLSLTFAGCVLWAQRKNRHWAFGFWGLLAPIGFLGISLLKDKREVN